ncbi:hypothetical protein SEA_KIKO_65 [Gordonia phage Kiko]|nr:hypothetical protein SEA_KIKO_65 [Gordonia phage Kiko]
MMRHADNGGGLRGMVLQRIIGAALLLCPQPPHQIRCRGFRRSVGGAA